MALNRFEAGIVTRGKGQSSIARAAYNAREKLTDERTQEAKDYRYLGEPEWTGIFAPELSPDWARDREKLWNAVERREDQSTRPDQAQLARDFKIALPHELTAQQRLALTKEFSVEMAQKGMVVDVAIHAPHAENDDRNYHIHMMLTMREITPDGFGKKVREWNRDSELEQWKERWSELGARHLERAGFHQEAERFSVGHLTLEKQREAALRRGDHEWANALDREPARHMGPHARAMENRGIPTRQGDINREIEERNQLRGIPREIRFAYAASNDPHEFAEALSQRDMMLARITKRDVRQNVAEFAMEATKYVPRYFEGEYIVVTEHGWAYRLTTRTTGDNYRDIRAFLKPLNQQDCPSLESAREEMKKRSMIPKVDRDQVIDRMMQSAPSGVEVSHERPRNWLEQNVHDIAATVPPRPAYDTAKFRSRTAVPDGARDLHIRGDGEHVWWAYNSTKNPEAFHESLKERGLQLARVTAEDARDSHTQHWAAKRQGGYHPILREGEYIAVNERCFGYLLNQRSVGHDSREVRVL